jgi:flagellar hook-associated protein 2
MAVSSTSSTNSTTSIDVAGIVDALMKAENIPLDTLKAKIAKEETVISDLGVIKGKVASFQSALDDMESISNFTTVSASSSDSDVISATGVNGTIYGSYTVSDITLAKATVLSYKAASSANFSSTSDTVLLVDGEFTIQVGSAGTVYTIYGGLTGETVVDETDETKTLTNADTKFGPATDFVVGTYENVLISGENGGGAYGTIIVDADGYYRVSEITSVGSGFQAGDALTISSSDIGGSDSESLTLGTLKYNGLEIDITELAYAINSLGIEASASVTQTISSSDYIFTIRGTETGEDNEVSVTGFDTDTIYNNASGSVTAVDASFKIDGTSFVRSSNTVSDVIDGVTFTLKAADATNDYTITVTEGTDNSSAKIQSLVTAYNDLIDSYKTLTANSHNSTSGKSGTFSSNPTMLYFINEIKARFAKGFSYSDGTYTVSLSSLGIDLAKDGSATFNATNFATTQADGIKERDMTITSSFVYNTRTLQSILAGGVKMGYVDSSDYLNSYIDGLIGVTGSSGLLADTVTNESDALDDLYTKQTDLEDRLTTIQNNYITQYSALNTLLYQLSVTSSSLTSALDALNNNNN